MAGESSTMNRWDQATSSRLISPHVFWIQPSYSYFIRYTVTHVIMPPPEGNQVFYLGDYSCFNGWWLLNCGPTVASRWDTNNYIFKSCTMEINMCLIDCVSCAATPCTCEREWKKVREHDRFGANWRLTVQVELPLFGGRCVWRDQKWILTLLAFSSICLTLFRQPAHQQRHISEERLRATS